MTEPEERYTRQIALFGIEGQRRLAKARVAVLGLGGLGSHACQQLAYLGVRNFVIVDDDPVEDSNLNRLVGAVPGNVGAHKTEVAERLIKAIQPSARVEIHEAKMPDEGAATAVQQTDLVLGCFDNDYPRLLTTALAAKSQLPYIDAATDVVAGDGKPAYGGRVVVAGTSPGCLSCLGQLDQDEIRRAQLSDEELQAEATIYGVTVEALRGTGPSVVSLNGVVASLAVMEAMVMITGLRPPVKLQNYYGNWGGRITTSNDRPSSDCYYCGLWLPGEYRAGLHSNDNGSLS
jgi:molybdopterin-synthase adenylyltransferase